MRKTVTWLETGLMGMEERIYHRKNDRVEEWYFRRFCIEKIYYKGKRRQFLISRWWIWNPTGLRRDGGESVTYAGGGS